MRTRVEVLLECLDIWQSYYDQIEMTDEDKRRLDELDAEYSEIMGEPEP